MNPSLYYAAFAVFLGWLSPDDAAASRLSRRTARLHELASIAADIASTDASESEARLLASIAVHESSARLHATGKIGEQGPFQVLHGDPHAREALRRLRTQGLQGYAGCTRPCPDLTRALAAYAQGSP